MKEGKNGCTLINDSYNSDLASLDIALDFMARRTDTKGRKRTLILSDILETGQSATFLYRKVAQLVQNRGIEKIIDCKIALRSALEQQFMRAPTAAEMAVAFDMSAEDYFALERNATHGRSTSLDELTDVG